MLIKYQTSVINLDRVAEFVKVGHKTIKFFFDSFDHDREETTSSEFEFESEEDRDDAFQEILEDYARKMTISILGLK